MEERRDLVVVIDVKIIKIIGHVLNANSHLGAEGRLEEEAEQEAEQGAKREIEDAEQEADQGVKKK